MGVDARMEVSGIGKLSDFDLDYLQDILCTCFPNKDYTVDITDVNPGAEIVLSVGGLGRYPSHENWHVSVRPHIELAEWFEIEYPDCDVYFGPDTSDKLERFDDFGRGEMLREEQERNDYPTNDQEQKMLDHWAKTAMVELLRKSEAWVCLESIPENAWMVADEMLLERRKRLEDC